MWQIKNLQSLTKDKVTSDTSTCTVWLISSLRLPTPPVSFTAQHGVSVKSKNSSFPSPSYYFQIAAPHWLSELTIKSAIFLFLFLAAGSENRAGRKLERMHRRQKKSTLSQNVFDESAGVHRLIDSERINSENSARWSSHENETSMTT